MILMDKRNKCEYAFNKNSKTTNYPGIFFESKLNSEMIFKQFTDKLIATNLIEDLIYAINKD